MCIFNRKSGAWIFSIKKRSDLWKSASHPAGGILNTAPSVCFVVVVCFGVVVVFFLTLPLQISLRSHSHSVSLYLWEAPSVSISVLSSLICPDRLCLIAPCLCLLGPKAPTTASNQRLYDPLARFTLLILRSSRHTRIPINPAFGAAIG